MTHGSSQTKTLRTGPILPNCVPSTNRDRPRSGRETGGIKTLPRFVVILEVVIPDTITDVT